MGVDMLEEEEELYRYALLKDKDGTLMSKVERQAVIKVIEEKERGMVNEIENKSRIREEVMMTHEEAMMTREEAMMTREEAMENLFRESQSELKTREEAMENLFHESKSELKMLRSELMVVTLACVGISFVAYFSLKH